MMMWEFEEKLEEIQDGLAKVALLERKLAGLKTLADSVKALAVSAHSHGKAARENALELSDSLTNSINGQARLWEQMHSTRAGLDATAELLERQSSAIQELAVAARTAPPPAESVVHAQEAGPRGLKGDKPAHEWEGTALRFENPDGSWGDLVDLKGQPGARGKGGGGRFDPSQLPIASDALPEQFIVMQENRWVRATYEQMLAWLGTATPVGTVTVNGEPVTVNGENVTHGA